MSGYTIVSWSCFCLFKHVSFFHVLKLFSFTFYFPSLKFSRCLPHKIKFRYTIVWFVWRVNYCVQLLSWGHDFLIFSIISFTFSFAKVFSFNYLITFLVSFIWNSQKFPVFQNIWCLNKTQLKNIKQFFKGVVHEQPWYIIVWFVWRVHYCVQLLSWGHDFFIFSIISFTFSFAKVFSFN